MKVLFSINILILSVGLFKGGLSEIQSILKLVLISNVYIISFAAIFYYLNKKGKNSSSVAFKMISIWLLVCVIIPGSVHQYASFKYPVNYMTDFLDVNRKETYEVFKLENLDLYHILIDIQPDLLNTKKSKETELDNQIIKRSVSAIIDQMNINAVYQIEKQNENKNHFIRSSYFLNPVSYVQNIWNSCTSTDYNAYRDFRTKIQESITARNNLIVLEMWKENTVDKALYEQYLKVLNN